MCWGDHNLGTIFNLSIDVHEFKQSKEEEGKTELARGYKSTCHVALAICCVVLSLMVIALAKCYEEFKLSW